MSSETFGSEGAKQVDKVHKALDEEVDLSGGSEGWREREGEVKRAGRGSVAERGQRGRSTFLQSECGCTLRASDRGTTHRSSALPSSPIN